MGAQTSLDFAKGLGTNLRVFGIAFGTQVDTSFDRILCK